jgi:hypothetical protein
VSIASKSFYLLRENVSRRPAHRRLCPRTSCAISVKELGLSSRAFTVLDSAGIKTVRQLSAKSDAELLATRNIGKTILHEIREKLTLPLSTITVSRWTIEEQLRQPRAYDLIVRAEEHIRRFIECNLLKHYGEHWLTNGISPAIQKKVINRTRALCVNWTVTDFLRKLVLVTTRQSSWIRQIGNLCFRGRSKTAKPLLRV